ncbi:MAG TPA: type IV pilin protein [Gammaproteobacteria bacterium]|nr:type IV pilin protein [Gammaproteobacteria bacterium]
MSARSQGFTLIELLVTVAILAIIAAIAYPSYRSAVLKSHRADAQTTLSETAQNMERCYTQYSSYKNSNCTALVPSASPGGYYSIAASIPSPSSYKLTATATGSQADDDACATLSLASTGARTATGTSTDECW